MGDIRNEDAGRSSFWRRLPKAVALFIIGVALECWMVFMIFQAGYDRSHREYTIITSSGYEDQTDTPLALMSFVRSISVMEGYSETVGTISFSENGGNILAGPFEMDSNFLRMKLFQQNVAASGAERVGTLAQDLVIRSRMDEDDYWALVRITEAETTGGDVMSKMMVAGVVLNRVHDVRFPDTIYDVVFQEGQFSPVEDGRYYSCKITDESLEAVDRVMQGEDYSQGALYFLAEDSADASKARWFRNDLTWLFNYGGHDFYTF